MGNQFIVLDFDKTLYRKDSLIAFHLFCLHKNPLLICWFPFQLFSYLLHSIKLISTQQFKNCYLLFLAFFSEKAIQHKARLFWEREFPNQFNEELLSLISNSLERIVIITASPVLYIQPLLTKLPNLTLLGTNLKNEKGIYIIEGQNCKGNEKVIRFKQTFGNDCIISKAYSDCLTDLPILALANDAFIVNENDIRPFKN